MMEANERKIVDKTKIDRIRSQQIRESYGVHPINEWMKRRREWDEHVTRMDAERLVKISRYNIHLTNSNSMAYGTRRFNAAFTRALQ